MRYRHDLSRPQTRLRIAAGLAAILAVMPARSVGADAPASIGQLAWLAGCWTSSRGERRSDEHWMAALGGTMLGMGRTVVGGVLREYEFISISERDGKLVFTARPSGQPEASFTSIELDAARVVFENAAHDFPQRIIYARAADGSLLARIEGLQDGKPAGRDFPMQRTTCR